MEKKLLSIFKLTPSEARTGAYALVLQEVDGNRRVPVVIGAFEAQAIVMELEQIKPHRPMTHDLFVSFALTFNIELVEVIISKFSQGIFYSLLVFDFNGIIREIDARTSDAVALAIRFKAPIYIYENVLQAVAIVINEDDSEKPSTEPSQASSGDYSSYLIEELEEMLQSAIENEEYEKASLIRDEIKRRKKI